jgi:hypothetical protein
MRSSNLIRYRACLLLLAVTLPSTVKAQFLYTTVEGTLTITRYTGPGGAVTIPGIINGLPVTAIGTAAFLGNPKLTSVTIDDNVSSLGMEAFRNCSGLRLVTIGKGVTTIGNLAFDSCKSLTNVAIGDGVTSFGENAFSGCSSLANIRTPRLVTSIPDQAFQGCSNLTSITIGASVTNLGNNAFENCSGLSGIYFESNAPSYKTCVFCGDRVTVYYLPGTSGWGVTFASRPTSLWDARMRTDDGSFGVRQNRFGFNIVGTPDIPIVVETSTNVASESWIALQSGTLTNGLVYFSDVHWTNYPSGFYRVRWP